MKNYKSKIVLTLAISTLFAGCKTQEQIQREQQVDQMSMQMVQMQKLNAETKLNIVQLQEALGQVSGEVQTKDNLSKQGLDGLTDEIQKIKERLNTDSKRIQNIESEQEKLKALEKRVEDQNKLLKKILSRLETLSAEAKKKRQSPFQRGLNAYMKGDYKNAKPAFDSVVSNPKSKRKEVERSLHSLGVMSYRTGSFQDTLTYFSKLYTTYPDSPYNTNGLLHMGRAFNKLGQKDKAVLSLEEMINKYPTSKFVPKAKELLKQLK